MLKTIAPAILGGFSILIIVFALTTPTPVAALGEDIGVEAAQRVADAAQQQCTRSNPSSVSLI